MVGVGRHLVLSSVKRSGFVVMLDGTLGWGVCGCVSYVASVKPSLMEMTEDDGDDAGDETFTVVGVSFGIGVGFLLIEPFNGEASEE